ncbi:MAG: isoprenylcysteine carboxylmethyltransferase family protein [Actinomycetota bacterium]|nr:isoprenylcysteine carboxylmethyltransferase family protein [Actinomycetota bacterium]
MRTELILRSVLSLAPIALAVGIALMQRPSRRSLAGVLVALSWNAWSLLVVNLVAIHFGWWEFDGGLPSFMGVAIEPWLGWTVLWGAFVPLAASDRPLVPILFGAFWLDLIAMPLLSPVLVLGRGWLFGEAVAMAVALLPSLLFSRWTSNDTHLKGRAAMQVATAGAYLLWLVPTAAIAKAGSWDAVSAIPSGRLSLAAQILSVPIALGVRAVSEFVHRGRGTPIPYDPPKQLVTSGPYSYVRNPMQLSIVLIFMIGAAALWNPWLLASAVIAFAYGAGLASWHESIDLKSRFGQRWVGYRAETRNWIPRWRPYVEGDSQLLVAFSCSTCSSVGRWFTARQPVRLGIAPAESSQDLGIRRITYLPPSGPPVRGVAAVFHALEHLNLGWAVVAWVLLLPGIRQGAQVISDCFGPTPQTVAGEPFDPTACEVKTA